MNKPLHSSRNWRSVCGAAIATGVTCAVWRHWPSALSLGSFVLSAFLFLVTVGFPRVWVRVQSALDWLTHGIMVITSFVMLGAVFLFCFIPGRWLLLLGGKDPLARALDPGRESYLEPIDSTTAEGDRFRRQF